MTIKEIKEVKHGTLVIDERTGEEYEFISYYNLEHRERAMCRAFGGITVWMNPVYLSIGEKS